MTRKHTDRTNEIPPKAVSDRNLMLRLALLYCLAHGLLLVNCCAIYWDDLALFRIPEEVLKTKYIENGLVPFYYFHLLMQSIGNGVLSYRIVTFFSYLIAGLSLFQVLKGALGMNARWSFYIVAVFLVVPVNSVRIALVTAPYALVHAIFFVAFCLLLHWDIGKLGMRRLCVLLLFSMSFLLNSLLVFYLIPIVALFWTERQTDGKITFAEVRQFAGRYPDFLSLPFLFFSIKEIFLQPTGVYAGYNKIGGSLSHAFPQLLRTFETTLWEPITVPLFTLLTSGLLGGAVAIITGLLLVYRTRPPMNISSDVWGRRPAALLLLGMIAFVLAVVPYLAVKKVPEFASLNSRHQMLSPLGITLIVIAIIWAVRKSHQRLGCRLARCMVLIMVTAMVTQNIVFHRNFLIDALYQDSFAQHLAYHPVIAENSTFFVINNAKKNLAYQRTMRFYEWNAILARGYGESSRFMTELYRDVHDVRNDTQRIKAFRARPNYWFSAWNPDGRLFAVTFRPSESEHESYASLYWKKLTGSSAYGQAVKRLVTMDVEAKDMK